MAYLAILIRNRMVLLQQVAEAATNCKTQEQKYILKKKGIDHKRRSAIGRQTGKWQQEG